jgi:regulator of RNase E activity RraA
VTVAGHEEGRGTGEIEPAVVDQLARLSTPTVLNGLKQLGVASEQLQSADRSAIRCMSPSLGPVMGYAATMRIATRRASDHRADTRQKGQSARGMSSIAKRFHEHVLAQPAPRIIVVENVGFPEGPVCIWGEVMANVYRALGCCAGVTNGAVRDLPEMEAAGFVTFAGGIDVGGGFPSHTLEIGGPVTVGGLTVWPGELLHGDLHGLLKVPSDLASKISEAVREVERYERGIIEVARSEDFSLERLWEAFADERH